MKHEHVMRQSWLGTLFECPEQARLVLTGQYPYDQTEAAAAGTAMHTAIQAVIDRCEGYKTALQGGLDEFRTISSASGFRWVKVKREATCLAHITNGFRAWYEHVMPGLGATAWCEERFKFLFHEDDQRRIYLSGTVDYAEGWHETFVIKDWKLSGNRDKYTRDAWKLKRFGIQPTVYTAAAYELGMAPRGQAVPFEWVAMSPQGGKPVIVRTERTLQHVQWLKVQCISVAKQIEKGTDDVWTLNDQSALCSPQWCTAFPTCRGKYMDQ